MLKFDAISKAFGITKALDNFTLEVLPGELLGLLGPNGAGKTTIIRMMAGLIRPTSGRILLGGKDPAREPEKAKAILGYIPDRPYLYEKLTGEEILEFIAGLHRLDPKGSWKQRSNELLEFFDLQATPRATSPASPRRGSGR